MEKIKTYKCQNYLVIFLLVITSIASAIFLDTLLPAIPHISLFFHSSDQKGQEIVFYYLLAMAISQLVLGSLMDKFGRRPILISCLFTMLICSLISVFSNSITFILSLSFIIGLGAGGCSVAVRAIARDCFNKEPLAHAMSIINLFLTVSPAIFPVLGSYLQHYLGWQSIPYFTSIYLFSSLLLISIFLNETQKLQHKIKLGKLLNSYRSALSAPGFLKHCYISATALSGVYVYFAISTVLLQKQLNVGVIEYGWLALIFATTSGVSRLVTVRISKIVAVKKQLLFGVFVMSFSGPLIYLMVYGLGIKLMGVFIPMLIFVFGTGFVFSASIALAFENVPHIAGTASSVFGFLRMLITCALTLLAIHLDQESILVLATMLTTLSLSAVIFACIKDRKSISTLPASVTT